MLTILEYVWVTNPEAILRLVETEQLSNRVFNPYFERRINNEIEETYTRLMNHDRWRRARGGGIRQLHRM
jgi:hypothetical protein